MAAVNFGKPDVKVGSVFAEINYIFQDSGVSVFPPALFLIRPLSPLRLGALRGQELLCPSVVGSPLSSRKPEKLNSGPWEWGSPVPLLLVRLSFQMLHCSVSALAKPDRRKEGEFLWRGAVCSLLQC